MTRLTAEAIDQALSDPPRAPASSPRASSPVQHVTAAFSDLDQAARTMADLKGLIDTDGMLHCWSCRKVTDWHVSLHCDPCRLRSIREAPERDHQERERLRKEREEKLRAQSAEKPVWGRERRFRDE